jgi:CheY-like chemotaxis protein
VSNVEKLEAQLTKLEARLSRYEMGYDSFADAANEINNQLAVLKGSAQLLNAKAASDETRELVSVVLTSVSKLQSLMRRTIQEFPADEESVQKLKETVHADDISILVVDDEAMLRSLLQNLLAKSGYNVRTASSGAEAIESAQKDEYDVILMDYRLGDMNGLEAFREIKKKQVACRVVFLTGDPNIAEIQSAVRSEGAEGFITKPFEVEEIDNVIHHLLQIPAA